jgi:hypothetical protein
LELLATLPGVNGIGGGLRESYLMLAGPVNRLAIGIAARLCVSTDG